MIRIQPEDFVGTHRGTIVNPVQKAIDRLGLPYFIGWDEMSNMETGEFRPLPNKIKKFLKAWDHGRTMGPCELEF